MAGPIVRWPVAADKLSGTRDSTRPRRLRRTAAILACLVAAASCTPQPPSDPPPSPATTAPPATPTPSPKPSPTSERERALAESKQAYIEFARAMDQFAQAGGGDVIPEYLRRYLAPGGMAEGVVASEMKIVRQRKLRAEGFGVLRNLEMIAAKPEDSPREIRWKACLDQSSVVVMQAGKPYSRKPDYLEQKVGLALRRETGTWLVSTLESRALSGDTECGDE